MGNKKKRQSVVEREKNKKGDGTISKVQLYSCYASSLIIAVICIWEAQKPETLSGGDPSTYYILAVLGIVFSVFISLRNKKAAREKEKAAGPRLK